MAGSALETVEPVRRQHLQRIPALGAPALADTAALEHDVRMIARREMRAQRKACLAASDDHRSVFSAIRASCVSHSSAEVLVNDARGLVILRTIYLRPPHERFSARPDEVGLDQKISAHQGSIDVAKSASARATAPSTSSSARNDSTSSTEREAAEIDGAERGDVECDLGVPVGALDAVGGSRGSALRSPAGTHRAPRARLRRHR